MYGCTPNGRAWEGSARNRGVVVATTELEWMTCSSEDAQTEPASVTPTVTRPFCENEEGEKLFQHAVEWLFWLRLGRYIQFNFTYTEPVHNNSSLKVLYILYQAPGTSVEEEVPFKTSTRQAGVRPSGVRVNRKKTHDCEERKMDLEEKWPCERSKWWVRVTWFALTVRCCVQNICFYKKCFICCVVP